MKERTKLRFPRVECLPAGIPANIFLYDFKIIQTPQEIVILPGDGDPPRQIHTDGHSLPEDPQPSWVGYSVGNWQGGTLVALTTGFNKASWLDLDTWICK
jgi:hypothetical protein